MQEMWRWKRKDYDQKSMFAMDIEEMDKKFKNISKKVKKGKCKYMDSNITDSDSDKDDWSNTINSDNCFDKWDFK